MKDADRTITNLITRAENAAKDVQYVLQRARRGWSDEDAWNINSYLADLIGSIISRQRLHGITTPNWCTEEEWNDILDDIVMGFFAALRLTELDYDDPEEESLKKAWWAPA